MAKKAVTEVAEEPTIAIDEVVAQLQAEVAELKARMLPALSELAQMHGIVVK